MASIFNAGSGEAGVRPRRSQFLNDDFQQMLARWNHHRFEPGFPTDDWQRGIERDMRMLRFEGAFIEELRGEISDRAAAAPEGADEFLSWFEALEGDGPGQHDPLFDWLAHEAPLDAMRWFLRQEAAGEAGFDDLVAMTQVKLPVRPKLELARNYWDEMGRGHEKAMHGPMLEGLVERLELDPAIEETVWESLTLANAMSAMAATRRYAWHSVGALGVVELTAPGRVAKVAAGLKRLGYGARDRAYFDLHATLDVKHSEAWNAEVLLPAVAEDPRRARAIAEGALIRLSAGERCFARYRAELGI